MATIPTQTADEAFVAQTKANMKKNARAELNAYLLDVADMAERLAEELRSRVADMNSCPGDVSVSDRFTWSLNDIENFGRNLNFSQAAQKLARFTFCSNS